MAAAALRGASRAMAVRSVEAAVEIPVNVPGAKTRTKLGEGAVWDAAAKRLLWIDIVMGRIHQYDPVEQKNSFVDTRQPCGTVVPHTDETVVAALCKGPCVVSLKDGHIKKFLGNPEAELPENRWNDGKCDPKGRLWVGSMSTHAAGPTGALYSVSGDGEWVKHVENTTISNGLTWSSDQKTFYYTDTPTGRIDAFDYDAATGKISNRRPAVTVDTEKDGWPDGHTIDADDKLWVCHWNGSHVIQYDPATGQKLARVEVPAAKQTTSCAFGGEKLDQLFITTASVGLPAEELAADGPQCNSGALFRADLSSLGARGVVAPRYAGAAPASSL